MASFFSKVMKNNGIEKTPHRIANKGVGQRA